MEDFGEIIYFLIIILIGIVSSLGKRKKKKSISVDTQTTQNPNIPSSWDELEKQLRKQSEGTTHKRTSPAFETVQKPQRKHQFHSEEDDWDGRKYMSYETVDDVSKLRVKSQMKGTIYKNQSTFKSTTVRDIEPEAAPFEISLDNLNDAKRAFVYSEIFTKKYD
ncbi:MAG: hypothetical protein GX102_11245 [Porphyromonadaceae bacterium]|jgi:hypothetical protein|nr:hypothetical protein [Porphyromonadaceae bacterium]